MQSSLLHLRREVIPPPREAIVRPFLPDRRKDGFQVSRSPAGRGSLQSAQRWLQRHLSHVETDACRTPRSPIPVITTSELPWSSRPSLREGGSSVARRAEIEPCLAVFCAW